jgi:hypothetical protein
MATGRFDDVDWPASTAPERLRGTYSVGERGPDQKPIARLIIDLYSVEGAATIKLLIPDEGDLEPLFVRGKLEVVGWRTLASALQRALNEIVEQRARKWWSRDEARFVIGQRVRLARPRNLAGQPTGTILPYPPPRRVLPDVVYRVRFDEPLQTVHGVTVTEGDVLEGEMEPLDT